MTESTTPDRLWPAPLIDEIGRLFATRQSRLWDHIDPSDLAEWVFAEPEPAPLDPAPAVLAGDWRDGLNARQQAAWALVGWFLRMTLPEPVPTAGTHWLLSNRIDRGYPLLRLTVGVLETLGVHLSRDGVWLRIHAAPIGVAMESGVVDPAEWEKRDIDVREDQTRILAEEKLLLSCPDIETVLWLLRQPPVIAAARMLNAWVSAGPFSFERNYQPEAAARAWVAAEMLLHASG